jgi:hypothetical protein
MASLLGAEPLEPLVLTTGVWGQSAIRFVATSASNARGPVWVIRSDFAPLSAATGMITRSIDICASSRGTDASSPLDGWFDAPSRIALIEASPWG